MALIVIGVGFLQFVLDKGQEKDWLSSQLIVVSLVIAIVALVALVVNEFLHDDPIMGSAASQEPKLRDGCDFQLRARDGAPWQVRSCCRSFFRTASDITASLAGLALSPGGIALAVMMPVCRNPGEQV